MIHKAERIIDERYSPSDKRCGGHITIAADGLSGSELLSSVRCNSGIILALFRNRLQHRYCGENKRLKSDYYGSRYQVALVKDSVLEFRIPSRFESVKQVMRRYELFYHLVDFSINNPEGSHAAFLKRVRPVVLSMYNGDEAKTEQVLELAKHFQHYINTGGENEAIREFLR
jgi:hypothetical protein